MGCARSWSRFGVRVSMGRFHRARLQFLFGQDARPVLFHNSSSEAIMRERGSIKRYYPDPKGYGFIRRTGCPDIFFHFREVLADQDEIKEGMLVEFDTKLDKSGRPAAVGVTLA
jgi:cold shock CspA family protein